MLRVRRPTVSALQRPAPLSAVKGSHPPRLPTADDRSQGRTRPDTNSPGCLGLWLVKRQAASDQQLNVGRPQHTRMQLTCCPVASKPSGLLSCRVCEPSRRMFPLRARATRVRGEHQLFRASKDSPLAAGDGTMKLLRPQACSVFGRAVERMRREEPRRRILLADGREDGRGGCGGQIASIARPPRSPSPV